MNGFMAGSLNGSGIQSGIDMLLTLPPFADLMLRLTALLALGWGLHFLQRRKNPRRLVTLWRGVAVGLVLIAGLALTVPGVRIPIARPVARMLHEPDLATYPAEPLFDTPLIAEISTAATQLRQATMRETNQELAPARVSSPATWLDWASTHGRFLCVAVWGSVALILLLRSLSALAAVRKIIRGSSGSPEDAQAVLDNLAARLKLKRPVVLRVATGVRSPFLCGVFRPCIVLPTAMAGPDYCEEWPAILAHELMHVQSGDLAWENFLHALQIVLWFHPLAWRMRAAHAMACEEVCDAGAARAIGDVLSYSGTLARVALEISGVTVTTAGLAMARTANIRKRLHFLKQKIEVIPFSKRAFVLLLLGECVLVTALAGVKVVWAEQTAPSTSLPVQGIITPSPELVWGEAVSGLRAAVELIPNQKEYMLGQTVEVQLHLQNISDHTITVEVEEPTQYMVSARDSEGNEMSVKNTMYSGDYPVKVITILSGHSVSFRNRSLNLGGEAQKGGPLEPVVRGIFLGPPGQYNFSYLLTFWSRNYADRQKDLERWKGNLQTGPLAITIKANEAPPRALVEEGLRNGKARPQDGRMLEQWVKETLVDIQPPAGRLGVQGQDVIVPPESEVLGRLKAGTFALLNARRLPIGMTLQITQAIQNGSSNDPLAPTAKSIFYDDPPAIALHALQGWQLYTDDPAQNLTDLVRSAGLAIKTFDVATPTYWVPASAASKLAANVSLSMPHQSIGDALRDFNHDIFELFADPEVAEYQVPQVYLVTSYKKTSDGNGEHVSREAIGLAIPHRDDPNKPSFQGGETSPYVPVVPEMTKAQIINELQKAWGVTLEVRSKPVRYYYIYDPQAATPSHVTDAVAQLTQKIQADPDYAFKAHVNPGGFRPDIGGTTPVAGSASPTRGSGSGGASWSGIAVSVPRGVSTLGEMPGEVGRVFGRARGNRTMEEWVKDTLATIQTNISQSEDPDQFAIVPPVAEVMRRVRAQAFDLTSAAPLTEGIVVEMSRTIFGGDPNNPATPIRKTLFIDDRIATEGVKGWQLYTIDAAQNLTDLAQAAGLAVKTFDVTTPAYWIPASAAATLAANESLTTTTNSNPIARNRVDEAKLAAAQNDMAGIQKAEALMAETRLADSQAGRLWSPVGGTVGHLRGADFEVFADPEVAVYRLPLVTIAFLPDGKKTLTVHKTSMGGGGFGGGGSGSGGPPGSSTPATAAATPSAPMNTAETIDALQKAWGITFDVRPTPIRYYYIYDPNQSSASDVASVVRQLMEKIKADPAYAFKANIGPATTRPEPVRP